MKREKHFSTLRKISLTVLLPVAAILISATSSCAKSGSNLNSAGDASAVQKSAAQTPRDSVFVYVDEMPLFPEGDNAILKYIADNTVYPEAAKKNNITGKVIVRFVVGKDCSVSDVSVIKSVDPLLDTEAVRVVSTLPEFEKPAKQGGRDVAVYYMLPITFALK